MFLVALSILLVGFLHLLHGLVLGCLALFGLQACLYLSGYGRSYISYSANRSSLIEMDEQVLSIAGTESQVANEPSRPCRLDRSPCLPRTQGRRCAFHAELGK